MTRYTLHEGPSHVVEEGPSLLSGYYRAEFVTEGRDRLTRYLTDKGRAEMLRLMDAGQRDFSEAELQELTVEPDIGTLETRTKQESGEGG